MEETTKKLDDLKQSLCDAAKAEDIEINSQMEVDDKDEDLNKEEIECVEIDTSNTDTDSESEDTVEVIGKELEKVKKPETYSK